MEGIQDKVVYKSRRWEVLGLLEAGTNEEEIQVPSVILKYFSKLVENAYIAGANRVNIGEGEKRLNDTGEIKVLAGCYCKDKGLKI